MPKKQPATDEPATEEKKLIAQYSFSVNLPQLLEEIAARGSDDGPIFPGADFAFNIVLCALGRIAKRAIDAGDLKTLEDLAQIGIVERIEGKK